MLAVGGHVLGEETARRDVRLATGLAGGVGGSKQEMCGALSGGVMVIGGLCGRNSPAEDAQSAYELAARYRERFLAEFGSTRCQDVYEQMHAPGGLGSCSFVAERAARILLDILSDMANEIDKRQRR
ncbi:MAG: C-GCAxxG-C-C family protein [Anaerolineae bacterium]|nr:C-GCAxxG-C-C family protein [Anaerolineae bacterium]